MPEYTIDINFEINTDALIEAEEEIQSLKDSAEETSAPIDSAKESMEEFEKKTEETNEKMQETTESAMGLGDALVGIGGAVGLDAIIGNAGAYEDSWNRLSLTFDNTGVSIDELRQKSSELNAETGRSGSQIRDYFNQMGIAGVTNTELLGSSFEALSGKAYQTNSSVDQMAMKMQMMVMSGNSSNRMLQKLGLTTSDLADAMGVTEEQVSETFKSLSQEERLEAVTKAMGNGAEANEMYKNSYAGLKAQAETSISALGVAIGQTILPIVIPALQGAKQGIDSLTATFRNLPSPVQSFIGLLGGGIMGVTALTTAFSLLTKVLGIVWNSIGKIISLYSKLVTGLGMVRNAVNLMRTAESLSAGVKAVLTAWLGAERVAQLQNAMAKAMAVPSTIALAIAENSLLLPILLVIGAIVGLVAILYYLYNNNETVRQSVDWLIQKFNEFIANLFNVAGQIVSFVSQVIGYFTNWNSTSTATVNQLIQNIVNAFIGLPSQIQSAISGIADILTKPFKDAWGMIEPYVNQIKSGIDGITGWFSGVDFFGAEYEGVGYAGFDSLNGAISQSTSNNSASVTNNFNINGIIEDTASEYIVNSVNGYIKKQNLMRGV